MNKEIFKYMKTLELDKILEELSLCACIPDAAEMAKKTVPESDFNKVSVMIKNTEDAYILMSRYSAPSFGAAVNVNSPLSRAQVGATLSIKELLDVAEVLRVIRSVKAWRDNCDSVAAESLKDLFSWLYPNKYIEEKINFAIKNEAELNDNASPLLYDLRRKISSKSVNMRESLDRIIHGPSARYLQEPIITQRDGRFVVPVKSEHRGSFPGLVHDTSSTGSTLFIEPMSVVETNNEIRVLKLKEQEEIDRILAELSAAVADFSDVIKKSFGALVELDFIFAKARYAYKLKASVPKINQNGEIYLKNARHPLINYKSVVPVTVELGKNYDTIVITGPNTGGKTVTLKTIGLLTLMTMCGLMIPVDDGSQVAVFNKVFADIGDEQSIEQSLSTFSSHMINIISILDEADDNSLVLFDELCAGTDPVEGAALAKAILMRIAAYGSKIVATTHYPELKAYAIDTDRVENASCEFDIVTLKPTYRLIVGMPGRSNAFAISGKLGLDQSVIDSAKEQISDDDMRFERVVASLEQARKSAQTEHDKVLKLRHELDEAKRKSDLREHELNVKREKLLEKTREQASAIIENARYKSGLLLNELEEMKKNLNAQNASERAERARSGFKKTINELEEMADPVRERNDLEAGLKTPPSKGDIVVICDINRDATVIDVKAEKKKVYVMSGSIKMWVDFSNLKPKSKNAQTTEIKKTRKVSGLASKKDRSISSEVDLRGMAADEAILELEKFINDAILSGAVSIRIIHGKGTGVLKKEVRAYLKTQKLIKTFRPGIYGEGEDGVTIAELTE